MTTSSTETPLTPEWRILELLARGLTHDSQRQSLRDLLLSRDLSWGELIEQALRNKMLPMLAYHVTSAGLRFDVPQTIYQHLQSTLEWNRHQIDLFRRETVRVAQALTGKGISFVVTKGMAFESTLYDGLGTRYMNDIDLMIAPADRESVMSVMRELGFHPFFEWAQDPRREEISSRLNPDHLPKLARQVNQPGTQMIQIDTANSLTWTKSPFDIPVEKALADTIEQPIPGVPQVSLPVFRPNYQFLFTVLHLFREAWLQKFVEFGNDVGLMKFGDVIRLFERERDALTDGALAEIMEAHKVTDPVAWVLRQMDEVFGTDTLEALNLQQSGDESLLDQQMSSKGYVGAWGQSMRERLQSKDRHMIRAGTSMPANSSDA